MLKVMETYKSCVLRISDLIFVLFSLIAFVYTISVNKYTQFYINCIVNDYVFFFHVFLIMNTYYKILYAVIIRNNILSFRYELRL